jgi:hypothetical protein
MQNTLNVILLLKKIDDAMFNLRVKGCEDGNKLANEIAKEIEKVGISGSTERRIWFVI